jgi:hypothetical protein
MQRHYCRLTHPAQAPIKSVYYWGWNTNDDVKTLNSILNLTTPSGKPQITNLHIFMDFPKNLDEIDQNDPVKALTVCPGSRVYNNRYVECTPAACAQRTSGCDLYGTMDYQLNAPVDPKDPSKGIKLNVYGPILQQMRQRGISIILSMLGGHGQLGPRTPMTAQGTQKLAQYFIDFLTKMNWDGIDFDDEYYRYASGGPDGGPWGAGTTGPADNMVALYKALYDIGHPLGYTFSLPFYGPELDLFPGINPYIDYAMDMAYFNNQTPTGGANLPVSKYMFGIGADDSQGITKAANYTAMCKPADPNRQNYPQGVLTFGGPYDTKAVPVLNAVAKGLYN